MRLNEHMGSIRKAALAAADPYTAVQRALHLNHIPSSTSDEITVEIDGISWKRSNGSRLLLVAAGKAAARMAQAAAQSLGAALSGGVVVTKYAHSQGIELPDCLQVVEAGHPVPDAQGVAGALAVESLLQATTEQDCVLLLLSGGASALLPLPVAGVSLDDLQQLTHLLLRSGATINEMNSVRKHLDRLKGGNLARLAFPAHLFALVLSDVIGDPLDVIASGPAVADPTSYADALRVLHNRGIAHLVPQAVLQHLQKGISGDFPETPKPGDPVFSKVQHKVIGSNRLAALAAAREAQRLGYSTLLMTTFLEGEAREVGKMLAAVVKSLHYHGDPLPAPACLIFGGETTVTVRGQGKGGRNQELAASAAAGLAGIPGVALMALATDGSDGPTDAAGALVDGMTVERAGGAGFSLFQALEENNTYPWLQAAGALISTGPTGTNVNDLAVILTSSD